MRKALKDKVVNFALLLFSISLCLFLIEVLFGVFDQEFRFRHNEIFVEHHALFGWRLIPNHVGTHVQEEYEITERINSRGIRGPEYAYSKKPNEYRILVLGDSFAEGYTVEFEETLSQVLKRELSSTNNGNIEVINTGTGGYSTDQELLLFRKEGKKYKANLTILLFHDNDVFYNIRKSYWRGLKPMFEIRDDQLVLTNVPVPNPDAATKHEISPFIVVDRWLRDTFIFYRLVNKVIDESPYVHRLAIELKLAGPIAEEFRVWQKSQSPTIIKAWEVTEKLLQELRREITSNGGDLLLFYVPPRAAVYRDDWQATMWKYGLTGEDWDIGLVSAHIRDICERYGIDILDASEEFRVEARRMEQIGEMLYFAKDLHWTAKGHELAGKMLAKHVSASYLHSD